MDQPKVISIDDDFIVVPEESGESRNNSIMVAEESKESYNFDSQNYKHLRRVVDLSIRLQRYCSENHLPIFDRINMHDIMIKRLT